MRVILARLHRWAGLFIAVFLFFSGVTGALIAWDRELDGWLNPHLFRSNTVTTQTALSSLELARQYEASDERVRIKYLPLAVEPGNALRFTVAPRVDPATHKPYKVPFNQVSLDPVTGTVQGARYWGELNFSREAIMPFIYKMHYTMHIPDGWGIKLGTWFMGIVSVVWLIDCFVALLISFPHRKAWRKSFSFRFGGGAYKLNFDLHRSGGVWIWGLLLIMALTSISMNLPQVMQSVVSQFSTLKLGQYDQRTRSKLPRDPLLSREEILKKAKADAKVRGWTLPAGAVHYSAPYGVYGVSFFKSGDDLGAAGLGNASLYYDGDTGQPVSEEIPGEGSAGDIFMNVQFPLHSGRIIGMPGRILISLVGVLVAVLSVTGVVIWARKRRARKTERVAYSIKR